MTSRTLAIGGRLDRYVLRLYVLSYLTALLLLVGLVVIVDMATNIDEYMTPGRDGATVSVLSVVRLYTLKLPFLYLQMAPFVTLVAGLFTAAKLSRFNEVVAALNAGISSRRLFAPIFAAAVGLALTTFGLREATGPLLARDRDILADQLTSHRPRPEFDDFWVPDGQGRSWRVHEYSPAVEGLGEARILGLLGVFSEGDRAISIHADEATWSPERNGWALSSGELTEMNTVELRPRRIAFLGADEFTPTDVELAWKGRENPLDLSFGECRELLRRDPSNMQYRTTSHYHLTFPLAGLLLLGVGLPFMVGQERGRAVERIATGFLICLIYFGLDFVCRTLGLQGLLRPLFAAWLPVVFFGSLGAVLYGSMRS